MKYTKFIFPALLSFIVGLALLAGAQENASGSGADSGEPAALDRSGWPDRLVIALPAIGSPDETRARYDRLRIFVRAELGLEVALMVTDGYLPIFAGFAGQKIDVAYMGPLSYIELGRYAAVEPSVMELNASGQAGYYALLLARADAGISRLEDARGKVLALVDRDSTSGFLIPSHHLITELKTPPGVFASKVVFTGTHDEVIKGVVEGRYDVGATNDIDLVRACREQGFTPETFAIVWKSELYPASPFAVRQGLPPTLRAAFQRAMLAVNQQPPILADLGIGGFAAGDDAAYEPVRKLMQAMQ